MNSSIRSNTYELILAKLLLFAGMIWLGMGSIAVRADQVVHGHILVRLLAQKNINNLCNDYNTCVCGCTPSGSVYEIQTPAGTDDVSFAQQVNADPRVNYAVPDTTVAAPEFHGTQFHLAFDAGPNPGNYTNQTALQQVHIGNAWKKTTGAGVIVAVLDTGASFDHPALQGHYLPGYNTFAPSLPPNDVVDVSPPIALGHGTMIAGIIAQVAPGALIMPVRVLDSRGVGTLFHVLCGIDYAVQNGAQVINLSMEADQSSPAMNQMLRYAYQSGVLVVASSGNDAATQVSYPASNPFVLAVTSVEADNTKSWYANCGKQVDVAAPGTGIRSTYVNQGYASWSGTSFAAPFVSAEAALLFSEHSWMGNCDVFNVICDSACNIDGLNSLWTGLLGNGLINIKAAVNED